MHAVDKFAKLGFCSKIGCKSYVNLNCAGVDRFAN